MLAVLILITFKGSSDERPNLMSGLFNNYIDESAAQEPVNSISPNQLADINSLSAYSTSEKIVRPVILNTIQDNSIVSRGTILTDILDELTDRSNQITNYTVQDGDTLSFIASDYGVSINTIIWANNLKSADDIRPGMELKIPPVTGIIHKIKKGDTIASIAKKYSAEEDKIISFNNLPQSGDLQIDDEIIVPDGKIKATPSVPSQSYAVIKRFINLPALVGYFGFPTMTNYRLSQGIHGRNGVDLADSCGTPIFAAADGVINLAKSSGYNGGFGRFVRITHPNGTETLYAHASQLLVSVGQLVSKGQQIALMGSTGHSTGCHVHFEVHGAQNPFAKSKNIVLSNLD